MNNKFFKTATLGIAVALVSTSAFVFAGNSAEAADVRCKVIDTDQTSAGRRCTLQCEDGQTREIYDANCKVGDLVTVSSKADLDMVDALTQKIK